MTQFQLFGLSVVEFVDDRSCCFVTILGRADGVATWLFQPAGAHPPHT